MRTSICSSLVAVVIAIAAGCGSGDSTGTTPPATSSLTYYKDVKPIVERRCVTCHRDGGIAPFALTDYKGVADNRAAIRVAVASRIMPPWLARKGCADYVADRTLTDAQIDTLT